MALRQPLFQELDTEDQTADLFRLWLRDMVNEQPGIIQESAFEVIERGAGANNSVDVLAGSLIVPGTQAGRQGYYYFVNDATYNLTMAAAHGSLSRIDSVIVHARDSFYSGIDNDGQIEYVEGTASASPVPPDIDTLGYANYWKLADITVGPNDNIINESQIADLRLTNGQGYASAEGAPITCTSLNRPSLPRRGQMIFELDTDRSYVWNGTSWRDFVRVSSWTNYTPTFYGWFGALKSRFGRWARMGNMVIVHGGCSLHASPLDTIGVSLPVPAASPGDGVRYLSGARMYDTSADARYAAVGRVDPNGSRVTNFGTAGSGSWGPSNPTNWAENDLFRFFAMYEV